MKKFLSGGIGNSILGGVLMFITLLIFNFVFKMSGAIIAAVAALIGFGAAELIRRSLKPAGETEEKITATKPKQYSTDNKPIYESLGGRIVILIFCIALTALAVCLIAIYIADLIDSNADNPSIFMLINGSLMLIGALFMFRQMFTNITFSKQKIIIKKPFAKTKECAVKDIIGYIYNTEKEIFNIYTNEYTFPVQVSGTGKKLKNAVAGFMRENNEKIKNKNIDELERTGILVEIDNWKQIHFFTDYLELITEEDSEKYFYRNMEIKHYYLHGCKHFEINAYDETRDPAVNGGVLYIPERITFNAVHCKGRIGLFEHLINRTDNATVTPGARHPMFLVYR